MNLKTLYKDINSDSIIRGITDHSKKVKKNYIFVAIKGHENDGNNYINEAIKNGAIVIISEKKLMIPNVICIRVNNAKDEYIRLLQLFYHYSLDSIYTIAITGTDGKTTISEYLKSILSNLGQTGVIGTNGISYSNYHIKSPNTTPAVSLLYKSFNHMKYNNIHDLIIEASSEGIVDKRLTNFKLNGVIISNLTHEHLNSHKTMNRYFLAKMQIVKTLDSNSLLVYNIDNKYTKNSYCFTCGCKVSYGFNKGDYQIRDYVINLDGSIFTIYYHNTLLGTFKTKLFGKYNMANALAAIAYTNELGIPLNIIKKGIYNLDYVDGRFMKYEKNGVTGIVDFAHTPNGIFNILSNLKIVARGKIILIIGAQGQKDRTKRPIIGDISTKLADIVIFTSEDPKNESLFNIYYDLTKKVKRHDYYLSLTRREAIKLAVSLAKENDYIVITGKGNENEEIIRNYHFKQNDYEILKEALDS